MDHLQNHRNIGIASLTITSITFYEDSFLLTKKDLPQIWLSNYCYPTDLILFAGLPERGKITSTCECILNGIAMVLNLKENIILYRKK